MEGDYLETLLARREMDACQHINMVSFNAYIGECGKSAPIMYGEQHLHNRRQSWVHSFCSTGYRFGANQVLQGYKHSDSSIQEV